MNKLSDYNNLEKAFSHLKLYSYKRSRDIYIFSVCLDGFSRQNPGVWCKIVPKKKGLCYNKRCESLSVILVVSIKEGSQCFAFKTLSGQIYHNNHHH